MDVNLKMKNSEIAFLFDLDGCLLDTVPFFVKITDEGFKELGFNNVPQDILFRGLDNQDLDKSDKRYIFSLFEWIGREGGISDKNLIQEFMTKVGLKYLKMKEYGVNLFDGVPELLKNLKNKGFKIGLVTQSSLKDLPKKLGDTQGFFDSIMGRESTRKQKPHPKPVLMALEELNVLSENAFMIGDTLEDVLVGKNAGTKTVAVMSGIVRNEKDFEKLKPDIILKNVIEISDNLNEILSLIK
ncbi:MAG: HAD family hydrolase [Candidatus Lokiarchaeota archaeon]|nr:HAD family hydrolase [Candidatus Lokiarchaeota archaeon]